MHLINAMYTKGMSKGDGGYKEPFICFIPVFSKSRSPLFKKKKIRKGHNSNKVFRKFIKILRRKEYCCVSTICLVSATLLLLSQCHLKFNKNQSCRWGYNEHISV